MKLDLIDLSNLKVSPLNVRKYGGRDVSDLVTSIRSLGLLQPLLVRRNCEGYDVVAGQRRLAACRILAEEGHDAVSPVPCAVMEDGDDAAAIEASLAENIARLPMDELDQFRAFAALIGEGRSVEDIAARFGVTERLVRQWLAIANLRPAILTLYRKKEIGADTMRVLTLATKAQQKAWLKLWNDPADHAPQGSRLRRWLLGGEQIATTAALFPLDAYEGGIVTDLFGEEAYFADAEAFGTLQEAAIADRVEAYQTKGWAEIVVLERGTRWSGYEHRKVTKKEGGKVFVAVAPNGEVAFHEGYLTEKELRRREKAKRNEDGDGSGTTAPVIRPELTKAAVNYVDLHRHAAVRAALLKERGIALRLAVAHILAGSSLWRVSAEPQRAEKPETAKSIEESVGEAFMAAERAEVLALLALDAETPVLAGHGGGGIEDLFERLPTLEDADVLRILTYLMAETLASGTALVATLGERMGVDMAAWWDMDEAVLPLVRERTTLIAMLAEIGGAAVAAGHRDSSAATIRSVIRQCAIGEGRPKAEGWVPRWLAFPAGSYVEADAALSKAA